jgi:hypothetical protein
MTASIVQYDVENIPPLEFLVKDKIAPDNAAMLEKERIQFRALSFFERLRLKREIARLAKKLNAAGYNDLIRQRDEIWGAYCGLVERYRLNPSESAKAEGLRIARHGRAVIQALDLLQEDHNRYMHYRAWIEYERKNRKMLKDDERRERDIRREMRKEAKWLETIMIDVFRKTKGCHHIETNGNGKEITRVPKFFKSQTGPDAHYFWLSASKRVLFGWKWLLPYGVNISNLIDEETLENMRAATKRDVQPQWTEHGQLIFRVSRLDSPDALPKLVKWRDTRQFYPTEKAHKLPYCIGAAEKRKLQWFNFADDPHILVAGKSQSGKSNLVNGIIATNVMTHTPDELRLVLVDQKGGIEFTHWSEIPHLLWDVAKTIESVKPILARVVEVMRKRMELLERSKTKDIASYNAKTDDKLPRLLVVIDEMNTFVGLGALTEDIHNLIMLIVSQGRAVGIHLIAATQHPEVKVIPGRIKTNMSVRMSGAMPSVVASQIVLDQSDAANLPNIPGRFVAVVGLKTLVVQVPRIEDSDIAHVVSKAKNDYPETSDELQEMKEAPKLKLWDEAAVIQAALEWTSGRLGGQKIHRLLGNESPGERHLNTIVKRIIERAGMRNGLVEHEGVNYRVKKVDRGHVLQEVSDQSDVEPVEEEESENV